MSTNIRAEPAQPEPYRIHCAEIWGGASAIQDDVITPGVRAAIHSSASGAAKGGDLHYLSVCAYDTLTRIAVADVRGHGEAVSDLSEWLYQSLEKRMNDFDSSTVLKDLNSVVHAKGFEGITTAVVATIHRDKGLINYSYAGHPPALLCRAGKCRPLEAGAGSGPSNLPLGILRGTDYTLQTARMMPGDRLFFYSDGVSECPGVADELYGDARMVAELRRTLALPLAEARSAIVRDLVAFANGCLFHDDCTFLLVENLSAPPFWKRRIFPAKRRVSRA
jgi:sigma-B regulation protein RsbU (phosphoserine phosphatase)